MQYVIAFCILLLITDGFAQYAVAEMEFFPHKSFQINTGFDDAQKFKSSISFHFLFFKHPKFLCTPNNTQGSTTVQHSIRKPLTVGAYPLPVFGRPSQHKLISLRELFDGHHSVLF